MQRRAMAMGNRRERLRVHAEWEDWSWYVVDFPHDANHALSKVYNLFEILHIIRSDARSIHCLYGKSSRCTIYPYLTLINIHRHWLVVLQLNSCAPTACAFALCAKGSEEEWVKLWCHIEWIVTNEIENNHKSWWIFRSNRYPICRIELRSHWHKLVQSNIMWFNFKRMSNLWFGPFEEWSEISEIFTMPIKQN